MTLYWETISSGYRYFAPFGKPVLSPFGFGLTYTSFEISASGLKKTADGIEITASVKNTGDRAGKEVVQIYLSPGGQENKDGQTSTIERPYQELKGFEKTSLLAPGRTETSEPLFRPEPAGRSVQILSAPATGGISSLSARLYFPDHLGTDRSGRLPFPPCLR